MRELRRCWWVVAWVPLLAGCPSPEDGRPRAGGPGADGGNYRGKPIHAPSKIDGTKSWPKPQAG